MTDQLTRISISYNSGQLRGELKVDSTKAGSIWTRIQEFAAKLTDEARFTATAIDLPWPCVLAIIREFGNSQRRLGFRFEPEESATLPIQEFLSQLASLRISDEERPLELSSAEIDQRLQDLGFTKRKLRDFQKRDLKKLLNLRNGANFSVPGAGKRTVTLALNLLLRKEGEKLLVVCPKAAFPAWNEAIDDCLSFGGTGTGPEKFTHLTGGTAGVRLALATSATRFIISYDQLITSREPIIGFLLQNRVHLVLDESHRMKGGYSVRRGAVLLGLATLPVRRDILTGTPMPQDISDIQSQFDFLWPGTGLGSRILRGGSPRQEIGKFYVRTTKSDLNLPGVVREFIQVSMGRGQLALYGIVRSEIIRQCSALRSGGPVDILRARRSVMRLLQLSSNPVLALRGMMEDSPNLETAVFQEVIENGPSPKMVAVRDLARDLAKNGRKCVIWTIFTDTILQLEKMLTDLNPVTVYGAVPSGDPSDVNCREGRIQKFKRDDTCKVFIANPAAAGEGISLHQVCHDAIYLDRSYNSTHYLQSIDRIHRLGLAQDVVTRVHIFQTTAPRGMGCIDHSVSRRLAIKLRAMQQLLDDEDLHRIALDEENADEPIDYDLDPQDLIDLVTELESSPAYEEELEG